ncbi:uncharacterized protein LOC110639623 [Hevea brasiliensis]|uniref:uncharacterized protein LOC110639623 n=1 Tax=Hevea brasiliensis TaxID=3981 RepID=UPI0025EDEEAB|nr:uncharacterized protein LOC110639623 [Hevea brasiliensis]
MLLRSSSTPVLESLLSSFSDTPTNLVSNKHYSSNFNRSPFHHQNGRFNLSTTVSCSSSPISPSVAEFYDYSLEGLRRTQSEGNLEGLAYVSCSNNNEDCPNSSQKVSARQKCLMLETIPSFSLCNLRGRYEEEEYEDYDGSDLEDGEDKKQVDVNAVREIGPFGSSSEMENMVLSEQVGIVDRSLSVSFEEKRGLISEEMYLARGLGIDAGSSYGNGSRGGSGGNGGGGGEFHWGGGDGDVGGTEEHYKKMVQENPDNSLFLRNYAQFLYQSKGDLQGAEEYYSRAILADPKDGEVLSQYAKMVWDLHHDQERASSYFERAVQASPEDSHVHAAYANFLWETEEEDDEGNVPKDLEAPPPHFHQDLMASTGYLWEVKGST